ncbi:putative ABC-type nitrate/sulfonate/bicarbonate transport system, permease component [Vibrio nigripulchritudo SFn27]|uniref:Putative ABC-type nitrate/sulfonate/bicarbonate transport system, permease component n=1 Tax=Vibrio nigripulchritudo TaxID=28173 RepID=U4KAV1_9VIBR|nr:ABC transporter permease [Vibrio nigripulchritudo]CCN84593.1 putative ABC-type nitrate/sulfonate/bicarbonate transport system, permease component [Vibrio nigripulchritudo BLFn1]CCN90876.1 putative ABC-type nitrate/sulfonate/bicarbonate transport system, permease component [Vibrio nigripulchritudo SFn27]CCN96191.1 putative ABC-type nitrate/sulfonate/bicarbonate transport system, permease component [Vibrio nigripulchritudo ENn2]CCO41235.1 putative ABC-type nitrate/sulfonate/bicarbonate transpo
MHWLRQACHYLWSGFGALASILVFFALWDFGNQVYGDFILPSPQASLEKLFELFQQEMATEYLWVTTYRALIGFGISIVVGSLLGTLAGLSATISIAVRPLATILIGIPPIAWIVLALLWFGAGDSTPIFTVTVTTLPITFAAGVQGARTLDPKLNEMAQSFGASRWMIFYDVHLPHILSYLFPSWVTALGTSWKVVVMAELLSSNTGVGAGLAAARVNIDTPATMAWIVAIVTVLLIAEYAVFEPFKRHMERWRE